MEKKDVTGKENKLLKAVLLAVPSIREEYKRLKEEVPDTGIDPDEHLWRPMTGQRGISRDLQPMDQSRMVQIATWLFESTPMGKRLIDIVVDFVIGDGVTIVAKDPKVADVITKFWNDPINDWDMKFEDRITSLLLFGEQCYKTAVNETDGKVTIGYIDPLNIDSILSNPNNPEDLQKVVVKWVEPDLKENTKAFDIIKIQGDAKVDNFGKFIGDVFYFKINSFQGTKRGRSELLNVADWIDLHEKYLFNISEKAYWQSMFLFDVTFTGMNAKQIKQWIKDHPTDLKPGTTRYHNEKVKWDAVNPKLEAKDQSAEARLIKNHILTGFGIPEHWMGEGDKTTRATALEMGDPAYKHFRRRQRFIKLMLKRIIQYVIDQAEIAGTLVKGKYNPGFSIVFPPLSEKDLSKVSSALVSVSTALATAVENDFITLEEAKEVFALISNQLGTVAVSEKRQGKKIQESKNKDPDYNEGDSEFFRVILADAVEEEAV